MLVKNLATQDYNGRWSAAMSGWSRMLGACAGVAMIIAGLLALEGSRWAALLMAGAAVVIAIGPLAAWKRSG